MEEAKKDFEKLANDMVKAGSKVEDMQVVPKEDKKVIKEDEVVIEEKDIISDKEAEDLKEDEVIDVEAKKVTVKKSPRKKK